MINCLIYLVATIAYLIFAVIFAYNGLGHLALTSSVLATLATLMLVLNAPTTRTRGRR